MKANPKTRMCWNCEGRVTPKEETCPYCGVSVVPASLDGREEAAASPFQALFSNYSHEVSQEIPPSPYALEQSHPSDDKISEAEADYEEENGEEDSVDQSLDGFKNNFLAILFLLGGSMLFLFGLTLALFSHQGVFTLSWDASLWFVYGGLSLPLLFLGWRILSKLD